MSPDTGMDSGPWTLTRCTLGGRDRLSGREAAAVRALMVRGGWAGHDPVTCTDLFRDLLQEHAGAGFAGWHGGVLATGYEAPRYQVTAAGQVAGRPASSMYSW